MVSARQQILMCNFFCKLLKVQLMFEGAHIDNEWQDVYLCETDMQISSLQLQAEEVTGTQLACHLSFFSRHILYSPLPLLIELYVCSLFCSLSKLKMSRRCITAFLKSCKETLTLRLCPFLVGNPCECFRCCTSAILVPRSKISLAPSYPHWSLSLSIVDSCCLPKSKKTLNGRRKWIGNSDSTQGPLGGNVLHHGTMLKPLFTLCSWDLWFGHKRRKIVRESKIKGFSANHTIGCDFLFEYWLVKNGGQFLIVEIKILANDVWGGQNFPKSVARVVDSC